MPASTRRTRTASHCSVASLPSSVWVSSGCWMRSTSSATSAIAATNTMTDTTRRSIESITAVSAIAAGGGEPPHPQRERGDGDRWREFTAAPTPTDEAAPRRLVGDEVVEAPPPRTAHVDGEVARRDGALGGVSGKDVLEDQPLVREERVTLERCRRRAHPGQFVLVVGRQDAQPAASGEIDHRGAEPGGGHGRVVGQHVHDGRWLAAQRSGLLGRAWTRRRDAGGRQAQRDEPGDDGEGGDHQQRHGGRVGEHHQGCPTSALVIASF